MRVVIGAAVVAMPPLAAAHGAASSVAATAGIEPGIVLALALAAVAYRIGLARLWRHARASHGVSMRQAVAFAAGIVVLALALAPPLDDWAARSFAAHMLQHEALMLVAAPLLVAGRPLGVYAWSLPRRARDGVRALTTSPSLRRAWAALTSPIGAAALQLAMLWLWHVPRFFALALEHRGWHALQHTCFLVAALAFWWSVRATPATMRRPGPVILASFITMIGSGALGALIAFAPTPWYPLAHSGVPLLGLDALEDQQIGGLLMWIPGGAVYMVAALRFLLRLLAPPAATAAKPPPAGALLRMADRR